ncbi:hypothetical protein QC764_309970 [Podospora pseudoanserina]|uniref:Arrestin-like N-terminal domain-containing protein n=1 Tax=Podospora pseudoanserina TaxID=2609844 RepID=A0ABR0IE86_9PEZI|nr:hypothetical protein QC764_309970 [Podospora pseudoanserina]
MIRPNEAKASPDLSIHLHAPTPNRTVFFPGEKITGQIRRQEHIVRPEVWLILFLHGRSVARIEKTTGSGESQTTHHYNTEYTLFPRQQVTCINGSPVHIPPNSPEGQAWNFQVQIPPHCLNPKLANATKEDGWWARNKQDPEMAFVPLQTPQIPLPCSVMSHQGRGSSKQATWVEYWLEAFLYDKAPFHNSNVKHVAKSRLPVAVYSMPLAGVQTVKMLRFWSANQVIRSQRLLAGREGDKLSVKEKMLKMVRSSRVPRLGFRVLVDLPAGIQLGELLGGLKVGVWKLHELTAGLGDNSEEEDERHPEEKNKGKVTKTEEAEGERLPGYEQGESSTIRAARPSHEQPHAASENDIKIRLVSLKIKIKATTSVSAKGSVLDKHDMTKETDIARLELSTPSLGLPGGDGNGIEIPFISEETRYEQQLPQTEDAPPPAYSDSGKMMDLGASLGIRFSMKWLEICGKRYSIEQYRGGTWSWGGQGDLVPDFTTFNIQRGYTLVVKLGLEVVKERVEVRFARKVEVLGATGYSS